MGRDGKTRAVDGEYHSRLEPVQVITSSINSHVAEYMLLSLDDIHSNDIKLGIN